MEYVALLRGINVGGHNKVAMTKLKSSFEGLGFTNIKTFINSGNVLFDSTSKSLNELAKQIEGSIDKDFGFSVKVLVRDLPSIKKLVQELPLQWVNDQTTRCDVMFLFDEIDNPTVTNQIPHNPEIEDLIYLPGAVVWHLKRDQVTKSKVPRIIGSEVYKKLTIRNANTVRKLYELMQNN